jgi:hypothetical protein
MTGIGVLDGAMFGLLGLLVAFTFSGAATRFDSRRHLVVEEANDIGTAWVRLDLLPPDNQTALRELFRRHVDARIATHRKLPDVQAAEVEQSRDVQLLSEIWSRAVAACGIKGDPATTSLVLSSINTMIDVTATQAMTAKIHPPAIIFAMLFVLALACSFLAGDAMAGGRVRCRTHALTFAAAIAVSAYVILDIEYPRLGFIRIDAIDQTLVELRQGMK